MGCCNSTTDYPSADNSDHANPEQSSQRRTPRAQVAPDLSGDSAGGQGSRNPLRPNVQIRPPSPLPRSPKNVSNKTPPWTRTHLEWQRRVYFETRVQGNRQAWDTLARVSELIREGNFDEAQTTLDAANLTCPTGRIARGRSRSRDPQGQRTGGGVFDERGYLYEVPQWCLTDPLDLVEEENTVEKDVDAGASSDGTQDSEEEDGDSPPRQTSPEEKGKGRARDLGDEIRVRARLSSTLKDVEITMGSKQTARVAAQRFKEQLGVVRVRLIYLGRELDENKTLEAQGWTSAHVLNAFVFEE